MTDPSFRNINRLFLFCVFFFFFHFSNGNSDPTGNSFHKYYLLSLEIKDFNALTENQTLLINLKKTNKKNMKNLSKCLETMIVQQEIY